PVAVGASSPKDARAQRQTPEPPAKRREHRLAKVASKTGPPVIEHRKPGATLPEGKEVTLRARVRGDAPIAFSGVFLRKQGESGPGVRLALSKVEGETYEAKIPADKAHGSVEYLLAAKDQNGKQSFGGDGGPTTWFAISFKPQGPVEQPFSFSVNPPARVVPGRSLTVRAQITGPGDEPSVPGKAQVLWRGCDGRAVTHRGPPRGELAHFHDCWCSSRRRALERYGSSQRDGLDLRAVIDRVSV